MVFFWDFFSRYGGGGRRRRRSREINSGDSNNNITIDHPFSDDHLRRGALPPSRYYLISRSGCPLLRLCWEEDWEGALRRVKTNPAEAYAVTVEDRRRTALHLTTMRGAWCPRQVLEAILEANPHAATVSDHFRDGWTPLHFLCQGEHRDDAGLVRLFVRAATVRAGDHQWADGSEGDVSEGDVSRSGRSARRQPLHQPAARGILHVLETLHRHFQCRNGYLPSPPSPSDSFSPLDMVRFA
jgi:hypothetical protein